ncbi:uncharacterized protein LOC100906701 [Galendromus occidentalis]|uniref:Uncharacterized protein LOC100906701 n=1 Tax=Galendromus occidentalis TaxID=34638 RepID=A0AAJ6QSS7_9ACAR|nr:uncharacterized protein LOC100906701 [Galendromus occidentalis]
MSAERVLERRKILLSCLSVYAISMLAVGCTDGAMLRFGILFPKVFCDDYTRCDNESLCLNHLNLTTGCYEKLCVPQENLTRLSCETLNCQQDFECKPCTARSADCDGLGYECVPERHQSCLTLRCEDDYECVQQRPIPGRGPACRANLAVDTHICKKREYREYPRTSPSPIVARPQQKPSSNSHLSPLGSPLGRF